MRAEEAQIILPSYAATQYDQGHDCPLTELLATTKCMIRAQRPGRYLTNAQDDMNLRILIMSEGTFFAWRSPYYVHTHNIWTLLKYRYIMHFVDSSMCEAIG